MHKNIWTIISALQCSGTVAAALLCSSYSKLTRIFVIIVNLGAISWSHEQTVGTLALRQLIIKRGVKVLMVYTFLFLVIIWKWDCVSLKSIWLRTLKYPFIWLLHYEGMTRISRIFLEFWGQSLERGSVKIWNGWSSLELPIYFWVFGNVCWLQLGFTRLWKELKS